MSHLEDKIQIACVRWMQYQYPNILIFHIPNGGKRTKAEAGIFKAMGVLAGAADLFIAHASRGKHGLYIEVKSPTGRQADSQKEFERNVIAAGYHYAVCRSVEEFIRVVNEYVNQKQ